MPALLKIPILVGVGGLQVNNPTMEDGQQHWMLFCPFEITGATGNRIGLQWELYAKPTEGQFVLEGEPTVFDVPLNGGNWTHSSSGFEDGVFLELKDHVGPAKNYRMVVTPEGGDPVQVDFSRDVGGVRNAVLFVGPLPTRLPPPPPATAPAVEVRAKFGWKTPA